MDGIHQHHWLIDDFEGEIDEVQEDNEEDGPEEAEEEEEEDDEALDSSVKAPPTLDEFILMIANIPSDIHGVLVSNFDRLKKFNDMIEYMPLLSQRLSELHRMPADEFIVNRKAIIASLQGSNESVYSCFQTLSGTHSSENASGRSRLADRMIHIACPNVGNESDQHSYLRTHEAALISESVSILAKDIPILHDLLARSFTSVMERYDAAIRAFWESEQESLPIEQKETLVLEALCEIYASCNCNTLQQKIHDLEKVFKFSISPSPLSMQISASEDNSDGSGGLSLSSSQSSSSPSSSSHQPFAAMLKQLLSKLQLLLSASSFEMRRSMHCDIHWDSLNSFIIDNLIPLQNVMKSTPSSPSPSPSPLSHLKSIVTSLCQSWDTFFGFPPQTTPFCQSCDFHVLLDHLQCPFSETPVHSDSIPLFSSDFLRKRIRALMDCNPSDAATFAVATNSIEAFLSLLPSLGSSTQSACAAALFSVLESPDAVPQPLYRMRSVANSHAQVDAVVMPLIRDEYEIARQSTGNVLEHWCLLIQYFHYQQREHAAVSTPENGVGFCLCSFQPQFLDCAMRAALPLLSRAMALESPLQDKLSSSSLFSLSASNVLFELASRTSLSSPEEFQSSCSILKSIASLSADANSMAHALSVHAIATGLYVRGLSKCDTMASWMAYLDLAFYVTYTAAHSGLQTIPEFGAIHFRFLCSVIQKFGSFLSSSSSSPFVDGDFSQQEPDFVLLEDARSILTKLLAICSCFVKPRGLLVPFSSQCVPGPYARLILGRLITACGHSAVMHLTVFSQFYADVYRMHYLDIQPRGALDNAMDVMQREYKAERQRVLGAQKPISIPASPLIPDSESSKRRTSSCELEHAPGSVRVVRMRTRD